MKIILDAMGGDFAPEAPVMGAIDAVKAYGAEITLVGRGDEILEVLKKNGIDNIPSGMEICHADDVVDMHDDPDQVIRRRKNSSMVVGLRMLAEGKGDAFVSAGSTGALLTGATDITGILAPFSYFSALGAEVCFPCENSSEPNITHTSTVSSRRYAPVAEGALLSFFVRFIFFTFLLYQ